MAESGCEYSGSVLIDVKDPELVNSIGVEFISTNLVDGVDKLFKVREMKLTNIEGTKLTFTLKDKVDNGGSFKCAFRMFPKNADLPHRQDFCFVRWF